MNKKILIAVAIVAGTCCVAVIYTRVSFAHGHVVVGKWHNKSERPTDARELTVDKKPNNKPDRPPVSVNTSEELKSKISEILTSKRPRDEKMDQVRRLLARLSNLDGAAKTTEWLKETVGDGSDFAVLVSGIFVDSNEPLEVLFKEIHKLPAGARSSLITVLIQKVSGSDDPAKLVELALGSGDPSSIDESMNVALQLILMQSESILDSMSSMKSIIKKLDGESLVKFRNAYLIGLSKVSPADAWREMRMLGEASSDAESWQPGLRDKISAQLRALGASESLEFLIKEGGSASEVAKSVAMWGNMNPIELNKWVTDQMKGLPASQQDGVRSGLADLLLQKRDFPAVREQLKGIGAESVRDDLERRLWEGQQKAIRQDVLQDPNGTLMAIVSGSNKYADYWLEEAMGTWVAKDFDKAQEWYEQNWSSLPASKSQYVAAAFANQAIRQGDSATARQWASLIQDVKMKQRIESGIANSEVK